VRDIGGRERKYMGSTIKYTDAPQDVEDSLENAIIVTDFLPSPAQLVSKGEKEKITIAIDKHSLDLYKKYAKAHNTKYQPMINGVLSSYADKFLNKK
jgi:predicted DNA binding CopG/RHH family protein